jgi:hypothetical protein
MKKLKSWNPDVQHLDSFIFKSTHSRLGIQLKISQKEENQPNEAHTRLLKREKK